MEASQARATAIMVGPDMIEMTPVEVETMEFMGEVEQEALENLNIPGCFQDVVTGESQVGQDDLIAFMDLLMEKLKEAEDHILELNSARDKRIDMIRSHFETETVGIAHRAAGLRARMGAMFPLLDLKKKKSMSLPHGKLGNRQSPDKVEITDAAESLVYADQMDLDIKTVRSVSKTTLMKHVKEDGVTEGPGWEVVTGGQVFFVKPNP